MSMFSVAILAQGPFGSKLAVRLDLPARLAQNAKFILGSPASNDGMGPSSGQAADERTSGDDGGGGGGRHPAGGTAGPYSKTGGKTPGFWARNPQRNWGAWDRPSPHKIPLVWPAGGPCPNWSWSGLAEPP